jgi:hypothetical protein
MIAITTINEHATKNNMGDDEKTILVCEYITHLDRDNDFKDWLERRDNQIHKKRKK